jgi:hypothetical protein
MIDGLAAENPLDVGPTSVSRRRSSPRSASGGADPTVDLVQGLVLANPEDPFNPDPLKAPRFDRQAYTSAASRRTLRVS